LGGGEADLQKVYAHGSLVVPGGGAVLYELGAPVGWRVQNLLGGGEGDRRPVCEERRDAEQLWGGLEKGQHEAVF